MKFTIKHAELKFTKSDGYVGNVQFHAEHHKEPYEITLFSKDGKEWMYGLHFLNTPGKEEDIFAVEEVIDENDEYFDMFIQAAKDAL